MLCGLPCWLCHQQASLTRRAEAPGGPSSCLSFPSLDGAEKGVPFEVSRLVLQALGWAARACGQCQCQLTVRPLLPLQLQHLQEEAEQTLHRSGFSLQAPEGWYSKAGLAGRAHV